MAVIYELEETVTDPKILRLPAVMNRVGLGKTVVYALIRRGDFPRPVQLSARAVGWRDHEVEAWVASRPRAQTAAAA